MRAWLPGLLVAAGCQAAPDAASPVAGTPVEGVTELAEGLADLTAQCVVTPTHVMQLTLNAGDVGWLSVVAGAIAINGTACGSATPATITQIQVTEGTAGAQTLILDGRGGAFGVGTAKGPGVVVALGTGADQLKWIGTSGADKVVLGVHGFSTNGDQVLDVQIAGTETITVNLDDGADQFTAAGDAVTGAAFPHALAIFGGPGNDTLRGGAGDDAISGGDGDDTFPMGAAPAGADAIAGGAGRDTVDYSARTAPLTISLDDVANDGAAGEGGNIASDIEVIHGGQAADVITGGPGDDTIYGGSGDDTLAGGGGSNQLFGEAGDDVFDQGASADGADLMDGGSGVDTVSYAGRTNAVTISLDGVADSGEAGEGDRVQPTVENATGGAGGDTITGSPLANVLDGGDGDDTISGGSGDDTLRGGAGTNHLSGGPGNDRFDEGATALGADIISGGSGVDTVDYSGRTAALVVTLDGATASGESGEGDLIGADVENAIGGAGDDVITGNASDNQLEGRGGADTLYGGAGDDVLDGGPGLDTLDCGPGEGDISLDTTVASVVGCEL